MNAAPRKEIVLITGGARSGKSRHALSLTQGALHRAFIATAEPFDDEMRERIEKHRAERDPDFLSIEAPYDLAGAIRGLDPQTEVAVVDCLTVWQGNLVHRHGKAAVTCPELPAFFDALATPPCRLVLVGNEVGMGIVPDNPLARDFRDLAGWTNQRVAELSHQVVLMVSGYPLTVKRGNGDDPAR